MGDCYRHAPTLAIMQARQADMDQRHADRLADIEYRNRFKVKKEEFGDEKEDPDEEKAVAMRYSGNSNVNSVDTVQEIILMHNFIFGSDGRSPTSPTTGSGRIETPSSNTKGGGCGGRGGGIERQGTIVANSSSGTPPISPAGAPAARSGCSILGSQSCRGR
jgi:hypothetical protein